MRDWDNFRGFGERSLTFDRGVQDRLAPESHDSATNPVQNITEPPEIPGNINTTFTLTLGQTETGTVGVAGDRDWFAVELVAGQSYVFTLTGSGPSPLADTYLDLHNEFGGVISIDDDGGPGTDSLLRFTATQTGTYFINARAWEPDGGATLTGGYTITFNTGAPQNPLDTIELGYTAPLHIDVFFQSSGSNPLGDTALRAWTAAEIDAAMAALNVYTNYTPITFTQVFSQASAEFVLMLTDLDANVLGHFGTVSGIGYGAFDPNETGWNATNGELSPGGMGFVTLIHEFGHGLGLAHPHYDGDDVQVMQGVVASFGSFGTFQMNQGVFTTMSYNDGWQLGNPNSINNSLTTGSQSTPGPLDIALLQLKYGANATAHAGDDNYTLQPTSSSYIAIWDTGGTDTISFAGGVAAATIDLRAATLLNAIGGGGYVSFIIGAQGGYTIANGAVIENATGGSGNDTLTGNAVANTLDGGAGADAMTGGLGDDTFFVDNAGDVVTENSSEGTDTVRASLAYTLAANVENLVLLGAVVSGVGNALNNTITGNAAANTLDGAGGADAMLGGDGNDTYVVDNTSDVVTEALNQGTDVVQASVTFGLTANIENLTLTGAGAINGFGNILNNVITGNGAANQLNGFDGADTLDGGAGADNLFGGNGDDSYIVDNAGDQTTETSALGGTDTVFSSVARNLTANIENLTLTGVAAITGAGNTLNNIITGNSAANTLYGFDGNDRLDGGAGADTLFGANGDDVYVVDDANDITVEGSPSGGIDTVESSVNRNLNANFENLTLTGTASVGYGNVLGNVMTGNGAANSLYGFDGNDTLDGGAGADQMFGADGDDTYIVDNASDVTSEVSALGGIDTVISSVTRNLTANLENLTLSGAAAITGAGNALNNVLIGNSAANTLYGLDGADALDGGLGADTLQGGLGADTYVFSSALGGGNVDAIVGFSVVDDTVMLDHAIFTGLVDGVLDAGAFHVGASAADADDHIIYDSATGALYWDADGDGAASQVQFATLAAGLALTNNDFIVGGP